MKILMVLASHGKLGDTGEETGFWLEAFAATHTFVRPGTLPSLPDVSP